MKYFLFTGGGSAGHVVPNLAVMHELRYFCKLAYMGTGGIEEKLVTEAGYPFFRVDCPKLVRAFTPKNLTIPVRLLRAVRSAKDILAREKPDLVFSKGGYASYPAAAAAQKLHIPVFTHESDLSAGLCTKLIAKKCARVLTSFPETAARFKNGLCVGSPMRRELFYGDRVRARQKYGFPREGKVLLVLGGGSGSRALNEAVRASLPALLAAFRGILHLVGRGNLLPDPPAGYVQREFEGDMGSAYAAADCVLSRAGSNTVFELLALKKPALLVPLAKHSRGDQQENARYFQKKGLVSVLAEEELGRLPEALVRLWDPALLAALAADRTVNGTPRIAELLLSF